MTVAVPFLGRLQFSSYEESDATVAWHSTAGTVEHSTHSAGGSPDCRWGCRCVRIVVRGFD